MLALVEAFGQASVPGDEWWDVFPGLRGPNAHARGLVGRNIVFA